MNILALDLSTKSTGYAYIENRKLIEWGCFTSRDSDPLNRIKSICGQIYNYIEEKKIDGVVLEEVRPDTDTGFKNKHTFKILSYLQAAVVLLLHTYDKKCPVDFLYPSEWRKECGIGQGPHIQREQQKQNDIQFVKELFGIEVNDDEADAIGLGVSYAKRKEK